MVKYEEEKQIEWDLNPEPVKEQVKIEQVKVQEPEPAVQPEPVPDVVVATDSNLQQIEVKNNSNIIGHVSDKKVWTNNDFVQCQWKQWMARIEGKDNTYRLKRVFLDKVANNGNGNEYDLSKEKNAVIEVNGVHRIYLFINSHGDIHQIRTKQKLNTADYDLILQYVEKTKR
jgi:hypothetical protein